MVCSFLILTIYPEVKDYHLHFTEGKKEITNAILCSALSSPSLGLVLPASPHKAAETTAGLLENAGHRWESQGGRLLGSPCNYKQGPM